MRSGSGDSVEYRRHGSVGLVACADERGEPREIDVAAGDDGDDLAACRRGR